MYYHACGVAIIDLMVRKVAHFSVNLKLRGVMEHPIGHFITPHVW